ATGVLPGGLAETMVDAVPPVVEGERAPVVGGEVGIVHRQVPVRRPERVIGGLGSTRQLPRVGTVPDRDPGPGKMPGGDALGKDLAKQGQIESGGGVRLQTGSGGEEGALELDRLVLGGAVKQ